MRTALGIFILTCALAPVGCGRKVADAPLPLSIAAWEALPVGQKYTNEALERLKVGNPKLQTPEGWEAFSRTTLARNRRKDFPNGPGRPTGRRP